MCFFFFFQAEDGIRDKLVTGVQTCALPISERRESAVVRCTELSEQDEFGGFQDAIAYFFGRFDSRIDRVDHADEDSLVGLRVLLDDSEDPAAVLLARELDVEVSDVEFEQAGQELPIVHIRAMS